MIWIEKTKSVAAELPEKGKAHGESLKKVKLNPENENASPSSTKPDDQDCVE